jgi:hypothetical protein
VEHGLSATTQGSWFVRPLAVAGAGIAAVTVVHLHDPHSSGAYGFCPFHALTGLWCPGCGGLRAVNDLTNGDIVGSLSSNVFVLPLLVVLGVAWVRWVTIRRRGGGGRMIVLSKGWTVAVLAAIAVFTIVRNTPWGHWLAPA